MGWFPQVPLIFVGKKTPQHRGTLRALPESSKWTEQCPLPTRAARGYGRVSGSTSWGTRMTDLSGLDGDVPLATRIALFQPKKQTRN